MIYLGYACDENYPYRLPFEQSVADHINLCQLAFAIGDWGGREEARFPMPMIKEFGRPIVQMGHFLRYLPRYVTDNDTILFVDVDAKFQRNFNKDEIMLLANLCKWQVLIGPNRFHGKEETWVDEVPRVLPTRDYFSQYNGSFDKVLIGNCGFIAMQVSTYQEVFNAYCQLTRRDWFGHHAGTQLFLCAAMTACGLERVWAPLSMAAHGHCGTPPKVTVYRGRSYYCDELIAYSHALAL